MILKAYEYISAFFAILYPLNSCHQMPTDNGHLSCLLHCEASRLLRKKIFHKKIIKCENLNQLIGFNSPYYCVHCV